MFTVLAADRVMADSKEFRELFESISKNPDGKVDTSEVFVAFRNVIGMDLLTRDRFDSAKGARFADTIAFSYEEFCQFFKNVDRYLETMPTPAHRRPRSARTGLRRFFSRRSKSEGKVNDNSEGSIRIPTISIREPQTPPLSQRVDKFESRLKALELKMSDIVTAQNIILSKLK